MKNETLYTVDYFINKFEAIPDDLWCEGGWQDGDRRCAGGHCGMSYNQGGATETAHTEWSRLQGFISSLVLTYTDEGSGAAMVNDGRCNEYQQSTPKQRILAALYDIKKMQEAQEGKVTVQPVPEKTKTVYVSVPQTIIEQSKKTVEALN